MRKLFSILAALSLIIGPALQSNTLAAQPVAAAASNTCTGPGMTWQHLGGDPFAHNERASRQSLPRALADMVAAGCLPQGAVAGVIELVRTHPNGTVTNAGPDGLVTLTNGMHLDFLESGHHPYLNARIGLVNAGGRGLVVGVQAKVWVFTYDSMTYYIYEPVICYNWAMQRVPNGPPPPQEEQCYIIRTIIHDRTDRSDRLSFWGPDANDMRGDCWHWRFEGGQWNNYRACNEDCDYSAVAQFLGMHLAFQGQTRFADRPRGARYVEYSVSREFAMRTFNGRSVNLAYFCRELLTGQRSCGKMVRFDDYHSRTATIYRTLDEYHADHAIGRVLVFDFLSPEDCLRRWTH